MTQSSESISGRWIRTTYPVPEDGWLLYSRDFVLQTLQGCYGYPERVVRNVGWDVICLIARSIMLCLQLMVMIFARVPVVSWFTYMLAKSFPRNAVGFFLRGCYWKTRLKHLGQDTLIDQGVEFNRPGCVSIGSHCHLDRNVMLSVGNDTGFIRIGDYVYIGPYGHMAGRGGIEIGSFSAMAAHVHIYSVTNLPYDLRRPDTLISMSHTLPFKDQCTVEDEVRIGQYAVIGKNAMILPGVTLGEGVIVHPHAEVRRSCPDFAILSGYGRAKQQGWRQPPRGIVTGQTS